MRVCAKCRRAEPAQLDGELHLADRPVQAAANFVRGDTRAEERFDLLDFRRRRAGGGGSRKGESDRRVGRLDLRGSGSRWSACLRARKIEGRQLAIGLGEGAMERVGLFHGLRVDSIRQRFELVEQLLQRRFGLAQVGLFAPAGGPWRVFTVTAAAVAQAGTARPGARNCHAEQHDGHREQEQFQRVVGKRP